MTISTKLENGSAGVHVGKPMGMFSSLLEYFALVLRKVLLLQGFDFNAGATN